MMTVSTGIQPSVPITGIQKWMGGGGVGGGGEDVSCAGGETETMEGSGEDRPWKVGNLSPKAGEMYPTSIINRP